VNKPDIEEILKSAYVDSGGSEREFAVDRNDLLQGYRKQVAINAALAEAQKTPTMSDYLREQRDAERTGTDKILSRFVNQEGANR